MVRDNGSGTEATVKELASATPILGVSCNRQDPFPFHPEIHEIPCANVKTQDHIHLVDRKRRTIRVDLTTPFEEIFGCFDGIQYDDDLAKDMKR